MVEQRLVGWYVHDAPEALKLPEVKALAKVAAALERVKVRKAIHDLYSMVIAWLVIGL
jgi:hypothetical protein